MIIIDNFQLLRVFKLYLTEQINVIHFQKLPNQPILKGGLVMEK